MTTLGAHAAHNASDFTPVSQGGRGFVNYLKLLRDAFSEGLQQAHDARRKHPFADV